LIRVRDKVENETISSLFVPLELINVDQEEDVVDGAHVVPIFPSTR
jgi:hypothetical protein